MNQTLLANPNCLCRLTVIGLLLVCLSACSVLSPTATPLPAFYSLDNPSPALPATAPRPIALTGPTLIINPPHAAPGYDSQRMVYLREPHKLEYFAHNEWIDPPARMLGPLLVAEIEKTAAFRAVVLTAGTAAGDLRLDTQIIRLQHDFQTRPSQVRFTLRAYLIDEKTRRVLAWREFDAAVPAATEDPQGGVAAANQAVQTVLQALSRFLTERQQ